MKRARPRQHTRRLKHGKRVVVNRGVKKKPSRYVAASGRFRKMTNPSKPSAKPSRFSGCVRAQMSKGHSEASARRICGYIAARKNYGSDPWADLSDEARYSKANRQKRNIIEDNRQMRLIKEQLEDAKTPEERHRLQEQVQKTKMDLISHYKKYDRAKAKADQYYKGGKE